MLIRSAGAVFISLIGAFAGIACSEKLKNRTAVCLEIEIMLRDAENIIRCTGYDVYGIVAALKAKSSRKTGFLNELSERYTENRDFRSEWQAAVKNDRNISADEKAVLLDFGLQIGTTDIEGQLSNIEFLIHRIHSVYEERTAEYARKGKLYRSLGMLAGAVLGIIII